MRDRSPTCRPPLEHRESAPDDGGLARKSAEERPALYDGYLPKHGLGPEHAECSGCRAEGVSSWAEGVVGRRH